MMKYIQDVKISGVTFPITGSSISRQLNLRRIRDKLDSISIIAEKSVGDYGKQIKLVAYNEIYTYGLELGFIPKDTAQELYDRDIVVTPTKIIGGGEINIGGRVGIIILDTEE